MNQAPSVFVFGGSFNPPHLAHVLAVSYVLATNQHGRVLVIPTFQHPFGKSLAPYEHRVQMCELAMSDLSRVEVSRLEEELGGESRTLRTVERLAELHPGARLRLVIGADILSETPKWFGFDRIKELAPPLVLGRVGFENGPTAVIPGFSSTELRSALTENRREDARVMLPDRVFDYMEEHRLYGTVPA